MNKKTTNNELPLSIMKINGNERVIHKAVNVLIQLVPFLYDLMHSNIQIMVMHVKTI